MYGLWHSNERDQNKKKLSGDIEESNKTSESELNGMPSIDTGVNS